MTTLNYVCQKATLQVQIFPSEGLPLHNLIFFAGGGWLDDNRHRFVRFASDLAHQGITVYLPQYRVYRLHKTMPDTAVQDALYGLNFIFKECISAQAAPCPTSWGGASAGGHLALCLALLSTFRNSVSFLPDRLLLLNPVCCPDSLKDWFFRECGHPLSAEGLCPLHDPIQKGPCIFAMHGTQDEIAPFRDLTALADRYQQLGGKIQIDPYRGRQHGFHHGDICQSDYADTLQKSISFLLNGG